MKTQNNWLQRIERLLPLLMAFAAVFLLLYYQEEIVAKVSNRVLDFSVLYAAVFDWSAIQTGFLFGIFGFIAGKNEGFIAEIRETPEMRLFAGYQKSAMFLGFLLTVVSIPLMVTKFSFDIEQEFRYWLFCSWCFLAVWAFCAFLRVAYIFGIIIRVRDNKKVLG